MDKYKELIERLRAEADILDDEYKRFKQAELYDEAADAIEELLNVNLHESCCEYCHEDSDGYVRPIEKNSHAWLVRRGKVMKLRVGFKGEYRECDILFCPMCGRRLTDG